MSDSSPETSPGGSDASTSEEFAKLMLKHQLNQDGFSAPEVDRNVEGATSQPPNLDNAGASTEKWTRNPNSSFHRKPSSRADRKSGAIPRMRNKQAKKSTSKYMTHEQCDTSGDYANMPLKNQVSNVAVSSNTKDYDIIWKTSRAQKSTGKINTLFLRKDSCIGGNRNIAAIPQIRNKQARKSTRNIISPENSDTSEDYAKNRASKIAISSLDEDSSFKVDNSAMWKSSNSHRARADTEKWIRNTNTFFNRPGSSTARNRRTGTNPRMRNRMRNTPPKKITRKIINCERSDTSDSSPEWKMNRKRAVKLMHTISPEESETSDEYPCVLKNQGTKFTVTSPSWGRYAKVDSSAIRKSAQVTYSSGKYRKLDEIPQMRNRMRNTPPKKITRKIIYCERSDTSDSSPEWKMNRKRAVKLMHTISPEESETSDEYPCVLKNQGTKFTVTSPSWGRYAKVDRSAIRKSATVHTARENIENLMKSTQEIFDRKRLSRAENRTTGAIPRTQSKQASKSMPKVSSDESEGSDEYLSIPLKNEGTKFAITSPNRGRNVKGDRSIICKTPTLDTVREDTGNLMKYTKAFFDRTDSSRGGNRKMYAISQTRSDKATQTILTISPEQYGIINEYLNVPLTKFAVTSPEQGRNVKVDQSTICKTPTSDTLLRDTETLMKYAKAFFVRKDLSRAGNRKIDAIPMQRKQTTESIHKISPEQSVTSDEYPNVPLKTQGTKFAVTSPERSRNDKVDQSTIRKMPTSDTVREDTENLMEITKAFFDRRDSSRAGNRKTGEKQKISPEHSETNVAYSNVPLKNQGTKFAVTSPDSDRKVKVDHSVISKPETLDITHAGTETLLKNTKEFFDRSDISIAGNRKTGAIPKRQTKQVTKSKQKISPERSEINDEYSNVPLKNQETKFALTSLDSGRKVKVDHSASSKRKTFDTTREDTENLKNIKEFFDRSDKSMAGDRKSGALPCTQSKQATKSKQKISPERSETNDECSNVSLKNQETKFAVTSPDSDRKVKVDAIWKLETLDTTRVDTENLLKNTKEFFDRSDNSIAGNQKTGAIPKKQSKQATKSKQKISPERSEINDKYSNVPLKNQGTKFAVTSPDSDRKVKVDTISKPETLDTTREDTENLLKNTKEFVDRSDKSIAGNRKTGAIPKKQNKQATKSKQKISPERSETNDEYSNMPLKNQETKLAVTAPDSRKKVTFDLSAISKPQTLDTTRVDTENLLKDTKEFFDSSDKSIAGNRKTGAIPKRQSKQAIKSILKPSTVRFELPSDETSKLAFTSPECARNVEDTENLMKNTKASFDRKDSSSVGSRKSGTAPQTQQKQATKSTQKISPERIDSSCKYSNVQLKNRTSKFTVTSLNWGTNMKFDDTAISKTSTLGTPQGDTENLMKNTKTFLDCKDSSTARNQNTGAKKKKKGVTKSTAVPLPECDRNVDIDESAIPTPTGAVAETLIKSNAFSDGRDSSIAQNRETGAIPRRRNDQGTKRIKLTRKVVSTQQSASGDSNVLLKNKDAVSTPEADREIEVDDPAALAHAETVLIEEVDLLQKQIKTLCRIAKFKVTTEPIPRTTPILQDEARCLPPEDDLTEQEYAEKLSESNAKGVPEKLIIVIDRAKEGTSNYFELGSGAKMTPLSMIKHCFKLFLTNQEVLGCKREIALITLNKNNATWEHGFSNVETFLKALASIKECKPKDKFNLNTVFDLLLKHVKLCKETLEPDMPEYIVRLLFVYARSNTTPVMNMTNEIKTFISSPHFILDILMLHESASTKNKCEAIRDCLRSIDDKGYFFAVSKNTTTVYLAMAALMLHPLLRALNVELELHIPDF